MSKPDREGVIRMAREAGFQTGLRDYADGNGGMPFVAPIGWTCLPEIENLVKAAYAAGADAESKRIHDEGMVTVGHMREQIAAEREARIEAQKRIEALQADNVSNEANRLAAVLNEREACAKVCEEMYRRDGFAAVECEAADECAAAIRARG